MAHDERKVSAARLIVDRMPPWELDVDLVIIPAACDDRLEDLKDLDAATGGELERMIRVGELRGKTFEVLVTPLVGGFWRAKRLAIIGVGTRDAVDTHRLRQVAAAAAIAARERKANRVALVWRPACAAGCGMATDDELVVGQAIAEGLTLGEYVTGQLKTDDRPELTVVECVLVWPVSSACPLDLLRRAVERGRLLGLCTNAARNLAAEPGGMLTPRAMVERARTLLEDTGVSVEALDEAALAAEGLRLITGVAQGSHEPPRLLVLRHTPAGAPAGPVLGLVGKGVTFDAGGISLKTAQGMDRMKSDMAGGAAVICAMRAVGLLGAPIRVVGIVPCAENMPGGGAIRPGDVLRSASGQTIEVVDTDAEGRLLLADALWYARQQGVTHLVDVATLTGACQVALGKTTSGLMGRPPAWVEHVRTVADRVGDRSWILPLFEDYRDQLRSEIADLSNSGGKAAGVITAAMFLAAFVGTVPWAHMDIAGTAWLDEARPFAPKGPTGVGVRTLAELAFTHF